MNSKKTPLLINLMVAALVGISLIVTGFVVGLLVLLWQAIL